MAKRFPWLAKRKLLVSVAACGVVGFAALLVYQPNWTGFGVDSTKNTERDSTGKITKTIEIEESSKTLWDWLGLLGVPVVLAILGYSLQQQEQRRVSEQAALEQKRASEQAALEKEIAEGDRREESLQIYFDRLSELLVDKNLIAIATKLENIRIRPDPFATEEEDKRLQEYVDEHQQKLDAAIDVIRARTLSILRRLKGDGERKGSVIEFLIETEVVSRLRLNLSGADLSGADLGSADLSGANFSGVNMSSANLSSAQFRRTILSGANLNSANLSSANLSGATLSDADMSGADLSGATLNDAMAWSADMSGADLSGADLSGAILQNINFNNTNLTGANFYNTDLDEALNLEETQISSSQLCWTKLPRDIKLDPDRDCKQLGIEF
jgi:uncharacterized protein YjbI with pentapeptide repeats